MNDRAKNMGFQQINQDGYYVYISESLLINLVANKILVVLLYSL